MSNINIYTIGKYSIGYSNDGVIIVIDEMDNYVTHIPCNLSINEVLERLNTGIAVSFDGVNQGMQNIPNSHYDFSGVAPREMWPLFLAWDIRSYEDVFYEDMRPFEEYREEFLASGLSPEVEMQIIREYQAYRNANRTSNVRFDEFRRSYISALNINSEGISISR